MADTIEIKVPDIGGSAGIPVIEVLVKAGESVRKNQGIVTLESDKATMEVPSPADGVIRELKVKLGDSLSEGSVVAILEAEGATGAAPAAAKPEAPKPPVAPSPAAPVPFARRPDPEKFGNS